MSTPRHFGSRADRAPRGAGAGSRSSALGSTRAAQVKGSATVSAQRILSAVWSWDFVDRALELWQSDPRIAFAFPDPLSFAQVMGESLGFLPDAAQAMLGETRLARAVELTAAEARLQQLRQPWSAIPECARVQRCGRRLVLWLYGGIGMGGLDLASMLAALDSVEDAEVLIVRIDSRGGSVEQAWRLALAISNAPIRSLAVIDRACFSAATLIAAACDRIHMRRGAIWLTHLSNGIARGDHVALAAAAWRQRDEDLRLARFVGRRRGLSLERMLDLADAAEFLSAQEAKSLGLIDAVTADLPFAASAQPSR